MSTLTIADVMQAYSEDAVELARERFKVNLDFSEDSLKQVEEILAILHNALPKGKAKLIKRGPSKEDIIQMAKIWAGYVGEVMRRRWGGEWTLESAAHGEGVITLRVSGTEIYPVAKVYKRLVEGPEENIWHYYQILKLDFEKSI